MMKKALVILMTFVLLNLPVHAAKISKDDMRQMQTHVYKSATLNDIMNGVLKTFADNDFMIQDYHPELGFITARKVYKEHYVNKGRFALNSLYLGAVTAYTVFSYGTTAASMYDPSVKLANELKDKTVVIDANVNIEQFGKNNVRIRFVPIKKILQNADGYSFMKPATLRVIRLYDKDLYEEFFKQVEDGIKCNI